MALSLYDLTGADDVAYEPGEKLFVEGRCFFSTAGLARLFGYTKQTINAMLDDGVLPAVKIGAKRYVPAEAVLELLTPQEGTS